MRNDKCSLRNVGIKYELPVAHCQYFNRYPGNLHWHLPCLHPRRVHAHGFRHAYLDELRSQLPQKEKEGRRGAG
jgi:hypothetical protein